MPSLTGLPALGMNLNQYSYYQTQHPFVDVGNQSSWGAFSGTTRGGSITTDISGNLVSLGTNCSARKVVFTHNNSIYPTGQYRLEWEGSGIVRAMSYGAYGDSAPFPVISSGSNYKILDVSTGHPQSNGIDIEVTGMSLSNPVRNIRFLAPFSGYVSGDTFTRPFLNSLTGYGVIRFMDWNDTNNSSQKYWSQRTTINHPVWTQVPYEKQIQLCNTLNADAWICVPHQVDNDYITNLATLVSGTLNTGLRCWVEYSNECWNWSFYQTNYIYTGLMPSYGMSSVSQAYGRRAGEVINIFKNICGTGGRVVGVIAGQAASTSVAQSALIGSIINNRCPADAVAIAPYFGMSLDQLYTYYTGGMSTQDLLTYSFTAMSGAISSTGSPAYVSSHIPIASNYGLPVVSYEGGQHLTPAASPDQYNNTGFMNLLYNIQVDPRMSGTYTTYLNSIHSAGNHTFVHFNDGYKSGAAARYGAWGLTNHYLDFDAPKYKAYRTYSDNRITSGTRNIAVVNPPVIIDAAAVTVIEGNSNARTIQVYGIEPITLSIVSGADQDKFTINQSTRLLSFNTTPDYELPIDSGANNVYNLTVRATNANNYIVDKNYIVTVYDSLADGAGLSPTSGLIRRWKMDDNAAASTIIDSISGFNASYTSGQLTQNKSIAGPNSILDRGLLFNASQDFAIISGISFASAQPLTCAYWVSGQSTVLAASGNFAHGTSNSVFSGIANFSWSNGFANYRWGFPGVIPGGWIFTAFTKNTGNIGRAYWNGVESTGALIGTPSTGGAQSVGTQTWTPNVLHYQNTAISTFTVVLSDICIWNRALSSSEIYSLYNSGSGFTYPWTPCLITSNSGFSVTENNTSIGTVTTSGVTPTFSIFGGNDASKVTITTGGVLSFITPPDYEAPTDFNFDNAYDFTVQVSNAAGPAIQDIRVTILDDPSDNPIPPSITNDDDVSIIENNTIVIDLDASGSTPLTFTINGGVDQALFGIDGNGILAFLSPPDYSVPLDANGDNIYEVQVLVYNAVGNDTILLYITVLDTVVIPPVDNGPQDIAFKINADGEIHVSLGVVADGTPDGQPFDQIGNIDLSKLARYITRFRPEQL